MTLAHIAIPLAFLVDLIYGLIVFLTNPRRATNQHYATLTIFLGAWLISLWNLLNATSADAAEFWIRPVLASTLFIPVAFNAIRLSMKHREMSWAGVVWRCRGLLGFSVAVCIWCFLPSSIQSVALPAAGGVGQVAEPSFGPGYFFFKLYHISFLVYLVQAFVRDTRNARGIWRTELQYLMFGCGVCIALAVLLGMILPEVTGDSRTAPLAPVSVILMNIIIAYGIATQRIMGVATVLRRITSYGLLTGYLVVMYQVTLWASEGLVHALDIPVSGLPHLFAALIVAFSLAYHDYEGVVLDSSEAPRLQDHLGDKNHMILRNHGLLAVGATVSKAFHALYNLQRACEMQVAAEAGGVELIHISSEIMSKTGKMFAAIGGQPQSRDLLWEALLRKLRLQEPDFET